MLKGKVKVMQFVTVNISETTTDRTNLAIANSYEMACELSIGIYTFDDLFKRSRSRYAHFDYEYFTNDARLDKSCNCQLLEVSFRLAYLHLYLTHSKGQGQGNAHFD